MKKTVMKVYLPKSVTDIYDEEHDTLKQILPYPLWTKRPEWTKKKRLEGQCPVSHFSFARTYAACPSVKNFINKTVVIPWTSDFSIGRIGNELKVYRMPENLLEVDHHPDHQLPDWEDRLSIKFQLPYFANASGPVIFTDPHLHKESKDSPYHTMLGLVNFDLKLAMKINTLWKELDRGEKYHFLAGTPMCYLTFPSARGKVHVDIIKTNEEHNSGIHWWRQALNSFILK